MDIRVRRLRRLRFIEYTGIGGLHHSFAKVHSDEVVLKDVVVEHVLRGLTEIDDPIREGRHADAEGHILRVYGAGRVIVAADTADPAGDEMRVTRIFVLHEYAVATED